MEDTIKLRNTHLRLALTLLLCLGAGTLTAQLLGETSAFAPKVRSQLSPSLLADNDSYFARDPLPATSGLSHPFRRWSVFRDALVDGFRPGNPHYALLQYAHRDSVVDFLGEMNVIAGYDYRWDDPGDYGFLYKGIRLNTILNQHLRLRALWWNGAFFGDLDAAEESPLIDGFRSRLAKKIQFDNLNADLSYRDHHLTAALGRGKFQVTNNLSGSLVLSDYCNDYAYLLAEGNIGAFTLSFLHGSLMADSTSTRLADQDFPDKYLALHQITYRHRNWLELFGGEAIVYGKRGLDLNYLLPHVFWRVIEHNQWDRDNVLIYGGMNIMPHTNLTLYLNLMLDELRYGEILGNWWGNKYGLQSGVALKLPAISIGEKDPPRLGLEITAIRPWTYTHYTNHTMYSHDRRSLGYAKGSNLIDLTCELNYPLLPGLKWDSRFSFTRQGSVGNDWRLNYQDFFPPEIIDTATADWLEGEITNSYSFENTLRFSLMAHHSLVAGLSSNYRDAWRHQLFAGWQLSY